jgi:hypothetical protein
MISADKHASVVVLMAHDALEATGEQSAPASLLLIDAALTILVTRITDAAGRREMAEMFGEYMLQQVDAVTQAGGAA